MTSMDLSELEDDQCGKQTTPCVTAGVASTRQPLPNAEDAPNGHPIRKNARGELQGMAEVYAPIVDDLQSVESILRRALQSETPFVDQLLEHSWLLGGKRIRPVFLLLSGASCGEITQPHLEIAASLEMIHTATLIHDDVLDNAATRRHRASANTTWGNNTSVLLGDYLFTHAFHLASGCGSAKSIQMLALASNRVCEGEMLQNQWQGDFDLSEPDYMDMIAKKTGELCGVGCRIGAFLADAPLDVCDGFESYGQDLGIAFQIIDDILDLVGKPDEVGKTLGTDLINQKPTLPVIHCTRHCNENQKRQLKQVLMSPDATPRDIIPFLDHTSSIEYARSVARGHAKSATDFSQSLSQNPYTIALRSLAEFVLERTC